MDSQQLMIVAIVVVVALAAAAWFYVQQQRRFRLRERFGPEYERAVDEVGPKRADAVLEERQRRVAKLEIKRLTAAQADSFAAEWRRVQARFVDDPNGAVEAADRLVGQVMAARGYPLEDFDQRAADLSVDHPRVVQNYRSARGIAERRARGEASTEDLRQATVHYRELFQDLLEVSDTPTRRRAS